MTAALIHSRGTWEDLESRIKSICIRCWQNRAPATLPLFALAEINVLGFVAAPERILIVEMGELIIALEWARVRVSWDTANLFLVLAAVSAHCLLTTPEGILTVKKGKWVGHERLSRKQSKFWLIKGRALARARKRFGIVHTRNGWNA
jgi:hypothetical protein